MEIYGPAYCKNCAMPAIRNGYSARPCGLKHVKREGLKGAMSKSFCLSSTSLYAGCGSDDQRRPRQGCAGPLGPNCSRWIMSGGGGGGHVYARPRPDLCYCGWWASVGTVRVHGASRAPLVAVADVSAGPCVLVAVADAWAWGASIARILDIGVGGLRLGLRGCVEPPGLLKRWRVSGLDRAGARSRSDLCYCGWWASVWAAWVREAARAPLVAVEEVWVGLRGRAFSPGYLLLRFVGFGWGCARTWARLGLISCGGGDPGGGARANPYLCRIFT